LRAPAKTGILASSVASIIVIKARFIYMSPAKVCLRVAAILRHPRHKLKDESVSRYYHGLLADWTLMLADDGEIKVNAAYMLSG
jgi:hypothetical protein